MMRLMIAVLLFLAALEARAAFEDLGAGARAGGMSQAFVAVADDVFTIYYNPAGLGLLERPTLGASYTLLSVGIKDGSSLSTSFVGYAQPLREGKYGTLAAGWGSFALNSSLYRDDSFYFSYGKLLLSDVGWGELYGGLSLKYLRSSFGGFTEASNGVGFAGLIGSGLSDPLLSGSHSKGAGDSDAGLLYRMGKHYSFGVDAMHLNQPNVSFSGSDAERLPLGLKLGFDYRSLISNLSLQYDTKRGVVGRDSVFTIAAERWFPSLFVGDVGVRGGMSLGSREYKQFTVGASYRTHRMQFDYAFVIPVAAVDAAAGSHQASLSFRFGRATDNEETLEMVLDAMKQLQLGEPVLLKGKTKEMSPTQKATLEEYLAQARALAARALYKEALDQFTLALTVAPADKDLVERFGRLNFVGQQIKALPNYKSDPMQASLHLGITAYLGGNYVEAIRKVSEALAFKPSYRELDAFLSQLENVTGVKRSKVAAKPPKDYGVSVLLTQANAAIEERRYQDAIDLSLKAVRLDEYVAAAWENLGTSYFALKDYDSSYRAWQRAYELEASPAIRTAIKGYLKSIARVREKKPARVEPVAPLPQRPSLPPEQIQKLFNEGIDHFTHREFDKAKADFEEILSADPENVEAQKALRRVKDEMP